MEYQICEEVSSRKEVPILHKEPLRCQPHTVRCRPTQTGAIVPPAQRYPNPIATRCDLVLGYVAPSAYPGPVREGVVAITSITPTLTGAILLVYMALQALTARLAC